MDLINIVIPPSSGLQKMAPLPSTFAWVSWPVLSCPPRRSSAYSPLPGTWMLTGRGTPCMLVSRSLLHPSLGHADSPTRFQHPGWIELPCHLFWLTIPLSTESLLLSSNMQMCLLNAYAGYLHARILGRSRAYMAFIRDGTALTYYSDGMRIWEIADLTAEDWHSSDGYELMLQSMRDGWMMTSCCFGSQSSKGNICTCHCSISQQSWTFLTRDLAESGQNASTEGYKSCWSKKTRWVLSSSTKELEVVQIHEQESGTSSLLCSVFALSVSQDLFSLERVQGYPLFVLTPSLYICSYNERWQRAFVDMAM